jgi:outer membrane protein assembly factor BamE (lipoprotein component of BamABCDE complex)
VEEAFPTEGWRDRENWRRLKPGLSEVQVRYLLGEPARVAVIDFATYWYYPGPRPGWVKLDREGHDVVSWAEP